MLVGHSYGGVVITETNMPGKVIYEDDFQVAAIPVAPAGEENHGG